MGGETGSIKDLFPFFAPYLHSRRGHCCASFVRCAFDTLRLSLLFFAVCRARGEKLFRKLKHLIGEAYVLLAFRRRRRRPMAELSGNRSVAPSSSGQFSFRFATQA